jgi:tetratricopeptide (TPR) repeat protein
MADNNLPSKILVIDDDYTVGQSVDGPLTNYKVSVTNCQDLDTAMYQFQNVDFDVVLIELEFEHLHGLALIQKMRDNENPEKRATSFILMSGKVRKMSDDNLMKELLDLEVIVKPFSVVHILPYLSRAAANKKKNLKFEHYRAAMLQKVKDGQLEAAVNDVKSKIVALGAKGIKFICELYEAGNDLEHALGFITPFVDKDPGNMTYVYAKGRLLRLLGRFKDSKSYLEAAQESSSNNLSRLEELGEMHLGLKDPEKAIQFMKQRLALNPENLDIKFKMFQRLGASGFSEDALKFCRETTNPKEVVKYYNNRGVELSRVGDIEGAIREYELALKFFPNSKDNYRIFYNIALAHTKFKNIVSYEAAAKNLEKCLELSPEFDKAKGTLDNLKKILTKKAS